MDAPEMSENAKQYLRWLIQGVPRVAFQSLSEVENKQLFRALAIPARGEVDDLFDKEPEAPPAISSDIPGLAGAGLKPWQLGQLGAASMGGKVLERMPTMTFAYEVVEHGKVKWEKTASAPSEDAKKWATEYVTQCVTMKRIPLNTPEDFTKSLPAGGSPPALTQTDFDGAANTLNVDVAAIRAVAQVESSAAGFGADGRPIIRYELHRFQAKTHSHYAHTHPYLSQPSLAAGNPYHNGTQVREYSMLYNAMLLKWKGDRMIDEAIESTSWGKFQVMGEHWQRLGWTSALQFARDMFASEANHLLAFVRYIQQFGLAAALRSHNWAAFAAGYNGPGYAANNYDTNMANAYARLTRHRTAGTHP
ncbi:MAG TPA: N-acetylmuramidase family protein [Bryobacteraceae bacterium]|jgi:hypothetical protein|nr:N-acetylmuramidase family protein [Bryobacteraceae bacterium]